MRERDKVEVEEVQFNKINIFLIIVIRKSQHGLQLHQRIFIIPPPRDLPRTGTTDLLIYPPITSFIENYSQK